MKTIKILVLLVAGLLLTSCNSQGKKETKTVNQSVSKVEVIDFHSTHRCKTCLAIEASVKSTLDTYFADEMTSGKITFQSINVDEPENEAIAEKFEAFGTSLFINVINNGKETEVNLTDFAFLEIEDKTVFESQLKDKIESELAKL